jgi:hypothetical protein
MEILKNKKSLPIELQTEIKKSFAELLEKADFNTKSTLKFELSEAKEKEFQKRINELVIKETQIKVEIETEKSRHKSAMEDINSRLTNTKNEMVAKVNCVDGKYYNEEKEIAKYHFEIYDVEFAEINGEPQVVEFSIPYSKSFNFSQLDEVFESENFEAKNDENQGEEE